MAARALIVEKGFEGLRTRDIAERVGINIATLHYHVPTKEALIELVADSARDEFIAQHRATPKDGMTGAERLRAEFDEFLDTYENHAELLDVMCEFDQRARRDPAVQGDLRPPARQVARHRRQHPRASACATAASAPTSIPPSPAP